MIINFEKNRGERYKEKTQYGEQDGDIKIRSGIMKRRVYKGGGGMKIMKVSNSHNKKKINMKLIQNCTTIVKARVTV